MPRPEAPKVLTRTRNRSQEKPGKWRHALDLLGKAEALKAPAGLGRGFSIIVLLILLFLLMIITIIIIIILMRASGEKDVQDWEVIGVESGFVRASRAGKPRPEILAAQGPQGP